MNQSDAGPPTLRFSLVMATVGRTETLPRFFESLVEQNWPYTEMIIIDQSCDDRLSAVLEEYRSRVEIRDLRSAPGLSRARNLGLRWATGDVIAFPDDDCWYPKELLRNITEQLLASPSIDGIAGKVKDENGRDTAARWLSHPATIDKQNAFRTAASVSMFLRKRIVERVGSFDEALGAGSGTLWGSGEETDYILRAVKTGAQISYDPRIFVHHPQTQPRLQPAAARRYGSGMGRVLKKHQYGFWFVTYSFLRPLTGAIAALLSGHVPLARSRWSVFRGRLSGYLDDYIFIPR